MKKLCFLVTLCLINFSYGQTKYESGEKFEFDTKSELNPQFVLADNYNTFLLTVINVDGMMAKRQMVLRKFDQTNKLVDKFTYDFPKFDIATLYNYLGYTETKDGKVAVFTETYSGKAKKSVVYKHEFDKATSKFTSTELFSNAILSASKSGTVSLEKSDNGNFIGINYTMYRAKEEAEKNMMIMLDASVNVAWQKEFSFADKFFTKSFAITNSGKVVYLRNSKGFKQDNYFVLATQEGQEEKRVETEVTLHKPKSISIGTQEYVLAFNYPSKGIRRGDFGHLLLFDLNSGKTIQNAPIEGFNSVKDIKEVEFTKVTVQNNEIHVFTEAKAELEMKQTQTVGSFGSQNAFPVKEQKYGPGFVHVLGLDGTIKSFKKIATYETTADLYHSYGLIDIKGNYYVATGNYYQNTSYFGSFFQLNASKGYEKNNVGEISLFPSDPLRDRNNVKYVNQLIHYFPDSNKLLFARIIDENQMSLLHISGAKL